MKRRKFLQQAAAGGLLAGAVARPALAQSDPNIRWRLAASWPKSLDTIYGSVEDLCKRVGQITESKFEIQPFAGGEIVPPLQVLDATQTGTVECGHTLTAFFIGKNPAFAFDSGVAFGLNTRQQNAWMYYGGGLELLRELFKKDGMVPIPCGNVGVQMGGFYRKEINTVDDLKGLKFRIGGLGGTILSKLGVVPQQIAAGDIYPALERGTIDAAEWIGPYDDEKLGLHKVAKYYYYPGWWEGSRAGSRCWSMRRPGRRCRSLQGCVRGRVRRAERPDDGAIRRQESGGPAAPGRRRRAARQFPASGPGRLLQGDIRDLRRARRPRARTSE